MVALNSDDYDKMDIHELRRMLDEVKYIIKSATDQSKVAEEGVGEVRKKEDVIIQEMHQLRRKMEALRDQRMDYENVVKEMKSKTREGQRQAEIIEARIRRQQILETQVAEFESRITDLDKATMGASWREWAFSYQIEGARQLAAVKSGILGDQRGLGKTVTSIIWMDYLKAKKVIVIAPKETIKNFVDELRQWASYRRIVSITGKNKIEREFAISICKEVDQYILCINLEAWRKDSELLKLINELQLDTVIVDEAHNIKNDASVAFKGVNFICNTPNKCPACGHHRFYMAKGDPNATCLECKTEFPKDDMELCSVKHRLPMTGTPMLNRPDELWPPLHLVDPISFPSKAEFIRDYCEVRPGGRIIFKVGGEAALLRKIGLQYVRRDRKVLEEQGIKIPPQKVQNYEILLDPIKYEKQWEAYYNLKKAWALFNEENQDYISVNRAITHILRLRQMIVWPQGIEWYTTDKETGIRTLRFKCDVAESVKMDFAENLIQELCDEGERVVVFSQFKAPLHELAKRLAKQQMTCTDGEKDFIRPVIMDGGASDKLRDEVRADFKRGVASEDDYKWDVVLCNYRVAGESLTLHAATQMVILDEQWNPGKVDQAYGRIDRIGQTEETTVHVLRCTSILPPTELEMIDTFMQKLIQAKQDILDGLAQEEEIMAEVMKAFREKRI